MAELQSALACAERVYAVLESPEVTETGLEELNSDQVKGAISFKHVSFGYNPEKILIKDLSIDIPAGSKVAIVGPTGAGKSTLINLIMRFYPINSGDILLDGHSIYDYTLASLRQQFGMVLQKLGSSKEPFMTILPLGSLMLAESRLLRLPRRECRFLYPTVATGL